MTYNELFLAIKNYLQNDFPTNTWTDVAGTSTTSSSGTAQINTLIQQAEKRVYNTVQIPALRKNVTGLAQQGNKYLTCPNDFLSVFSMAVVDGDGLLELHLRVGVLVERAAHLGNRVLPPTPQELEHGSIVDRGRRRGSRRVRERRVSRVR